MLLYFLGGNLSCCPVKLLFLDAIIENLTVLLCREDVPVFFESDLSLLDRLIHARNALRMR